jgi:hypothetical protein
MAADIVQRIDTFLGVADDELSAPEGDGAHAALGDIRQRQGWLKLGIAHCRVVLRFGNAHFNRGASPIVLNLCAALLYQLAAKSCGGARVLSRRQKSVVVARAVPARSRCRLRRWR